MNAAIAHLRNHLAQREHIRQRKVSDAVNEQAVREAMRLTTVDEHFDQAMAAIAEPSIADEAEQWLAGGAA